MTKDGLPLRILAGKGKAGWDRQCEDLGARRDSKRTSSGYSKVIYASLRVEEFGLIVVLRKENKSGSEGDMAEPRKKSVLFLSGD